MITTDKIATESPPPKLALTRVEAAKALGYSPATIDRLLD
jgi:hypothetical protein